MELNDMRLTPEVVHTINQELEYQFRLPRDGAGVAGQILLLERYAQKARNVWADAAGDDEALRMLRKCAGIAVRALLLYDQPASAGVA